MKIAACVALLLAGPVLADDPMTAAAFDEFTTGRTLGYAGAGGVFGLERYHDGRRVTWAFLGQECRTGTWYPDGANICFVYDHDPEPKCWQFIARGDSLDAWFLDGKTLVPGYAVVATDEPLICPGPGV